MNLDRFPPEEHWERAIPDEKRQGLRLKEAMKDPRLQSWHWLDICREFEANKERTEFDALIWVPNKGFLILDFKTANRSRLNWSKEERERVLGRVQRQATLFRKHLARVGLDPSYKIWAEGQEPPVIPIVGVMNVSEAALTSSIKLWKDRAQPSVFVIGKECWKEGSSEDLATRLREIAEEAHTGYKKTFPMSHGPKTVWDDEQVEKFWKVFSGETRPKSHFPEFLDTAVEELDHDTDKGVRSYWLDSVSGQLESSPLLFSTDSVPVPVPDLIYGGYVHGSAGTGKTWLALWTAINASYGGTRDVLLLTRSSELVETLRERTTEWLEDQDESVRLAIKNRLKIRTPQEMLGQGHPDSDQRMQWDQSSFWMDLSGKHAASFDVVLVDEAQDYVEFSDSDLTPFHYLAGLLRESEPPAAMQANEVEVPTPLMVLFGDPHQTTASTAPGVRWSPPVDAFGRVPLLELSVNRRSTGVIVKEINDQVGQRYRVNALDQIPSGGPAEVTFRAIGGDGTPEDVTEAVRMSLNEIAKLWGAKQANALPQGQQRRIAILFDNDESRKDFLLWRDKQNPKPEYRISDVDSFKGLESDVVVLVVTGHYSDMYHYSANLYTGMSRAQGHLVVLSRQT